MEQARCVADSSLNRYFCVVEVETGAATNPFELWVFDLRTYARLERVSLTGAISGRFRRLVRWGNAGLALLSDDAIYDGPGGLFLIDGAMVNPNETAPPVDGTQGTSATPSAWLTTVSPQFARQGDGDTTVTITGSHFKPNIVVAWNYGFIDAAFLPTTFVSPNELKALIPSGILTTAKSAILTVLDPDSSVCATNSLGFTVLAAPGANSKLTALNLSALDLAWDAKNSRLYAAVQEFDAAYPNTIAAIDPAMGMIKGATNVGSNPFHLSVSAEEQYLYVGFEGATNVSRLALPGLDSPLTWPLHDPNGYGPFFAVDVKAAPVDPHTTAVDMWVYPYHAAQGSMACCISIYDDAVQRPKIVDFLSGKALVPLGQEVQFPDFDVIAWGATDSILGSVDNYYQSSTPFYSLEVDASGPTLLAIYPSLSDPDIRLHSDNGLIYLDNGKVVNPVTGALVGSYGASGIVVPDSLLNRVFILGQTAAQVDSNSYTIQSFNQNTFEMVSSTTIPNLVGVPIALVRWGTSGLALATFNQSSFGIHGPGGMVYLLEDSTFVSSAKANTLVPTEKSELVQDRWKQQLNADLMKTFRHGELKTKSF